MESWTWGDVFVYFLCTFLSIARTLPVLGILAFLVQFPFFLFVLLPYELVSEFKITSFERRHANRTYYSFFQFSALAFVRWVLRTFEPESIRAMFFSDIHARALFQFRRFKYGTENIGDFEYYPHSQEVPLQLYEPLLPAGGNCFNTKKESQTKGFWVRSKSRIECSPDLVVYFVPGALSGCASAYLYLEFLSMFLVELQVQGFRNPAVYCLDVDFYDEKGHGFHEYVLEVQKGWYVASNAYPRAKTMFMGSGVGGTALLSLLLHIARPHAGVLPLPRGPCVAGITSIPSIISEETSQAHIELPKSTIPSTGSTPLRSNNSEGNANNSFESSSLGDHKYYEPLKSPLQDPESVLHGEPLLSQFHQYFDHRSFKSAEYRPSSIQVYLDPRSRSEPVIQLEDSLSSVPVRDSTETHNSIESTGNYISSLDNVVAPIAASQHSFVNRFGEPLESFVKNANITTLSIATTPTATPTARTPIAQTPIAQTPTAQTPTAQTPTAQTPISATPNAQTPIAVTPTAQTPIAATPTAQTPTPNAQTPIAPLSPQPNVDFQSGHGFSGLDECIPDYTNENEKSLVLETLELKQPDAVVLISPVSKIGGAHGSQYPDFISKEVLNHLEELVPKPEPCAMPGCIQSPEWWSEAIPSRGIAVYYGGNETQKREIDQLVTILRSSRDPRVFADCRGDEVHSWPITNAYTGRTMTDQMDGVRLVCTGTAKMLVMDCLFANSSIA